MNAVPFRNKRQATNFRHAARDNHTAHSTENEELKCQGDSKKQRLEPMVLMKRNFLQTPIAARSSGQHWSVEHTYNEVAFFFFPSLSLITTPSELSTAHAGSSPLQVSVLHRHQISHSWNREQSAKEKRENRSHLVSLPLVAQCLTPAETTIRDQQQQRAAGKSSHFRA